MSVEEYYGLCEISAVERKHIVENNFKTQGKLK
jgi:hypothetical protein